MQAARYTTLPAALAYRAQHCPDQQAFIFRARTGLRRHRITFGQWHRLAGRYAAILRKKGVVKGTMVLNTLPNSPERVVCEMGVLYTGAATVNSQCLMTDGSDVMRHLRQSRCAVILLDPDVTNSPWAPLQRHARISEDGLVTSDEMPDLKRVELIRRRGDKKSGDGKEGKDGDDFLARLQADLDAGEDWLMANDITADDVCTVFSTSGTTGFSKLAVHTHKNIVCLLEAITRASKLVDNGDPVTVYQNSPLGWYGGYPSSFLLMCRTRVLCDERDGTPENKPAFIAQCVREENCTFATISPSDMNALLLRQKKGAQKTLSAVGKNDILTSEEEMGKEQNEETDTNNEKEPDPQKGEKMRKNRDKNDVQKGQTYSEKETETETETETEKKNPPECQDSQKGRHQEQNQPDSTEDRRGDSWLEPTTTNSERDEENLVWKQGQVSMLAVTGQPVTRAIVKRALSLGSSVLVMYASTEMGPVSQVTITPATADQFQDYFVGYPIPGIQVRVVDETDEDTPLPDGQVGHLLIKHPYGFTGYLNDPEATAAAFTHDGFFRTGDRAHVSIDGKGKKALNVCGRMGNAIMRGPIIFYPEWIEARVCACPGVLGAIVVGLPDEETGSGSSELCACVVLEDGVSVKRVREHVEQEMVARSVNDLTGRPDRYLRFAEFPLLYTGRPNRRLVEEMAKQRVKGNVDV